MFVHEIKFKVAGVTYENDEGKDIQAEIKRIVNGYKRAGEIDEEDLYGGFTNREIKEDELDVDELQDIPFEGKIEESTYENELCYKIYLKNVNGAYIHIGYVPQRKIAEVKEYMSQGLEMKCGFEIIGGKNKSVEDGKVVTDEIAYGTEVRMSFFNDEVWELQEQPEEEKPPKTTEEKLKTLIIWLSIITIVCIILSITQK